MANSALTVPNLITVARFIAVPVIVWLMIREEWMIAFWLFALAGASDAVDGVIARQFNQKSEIGAWLDPIADKALLVAAFLVFAFKGLLPAWLIILAVARDILIVGGVMLASLMARAMTIQPLMVSKATTLFQILLVAYIFAAQAWSFDTGNVGDLLIAATAGLTLVSAGAYAVVWFRHMAETEEQR